MRTTLRMKLWKVSNWFEDGLKGTGDKVLLKKRRSDGGPNDLNSLFLDIKVRTVKLGGRVPSGGRGQLQGRRSCAFGLSKERPRSAAPLFKNVRV